MMYIYVSISKSGCIIFYTLCVYNSSYIRLQNKSDLVKGFIKVEWHSEITKDRLRNFRDNKRRIERKRREKKTPSQDPNIVKQKEIPAEIFI